MTFNEKRILGKTSIEVGRLWISSSFGAPCEAYEEAFEKGCKYFTWGNVIKGRSLAMKKEMINIIQKGQRGQLVIVINTYVHNAFLTEKLLVRGLKTL